MIMFYRPSDKVSVLKVENYSIDVGEGLCLVFGVYVFMILMRIVVNEALILKSKLYTVIIHSKIYRL